MPARFNRDFRECGVYTCKLNIVTELVTNVMNKFLFALCPFSLMPLRTKKTTTDRRKMFTHFSRPTKFFFFFRWLALCGRFYLIINSNLTKNLKAYVFFLYVCLCCCCRCFIKISSLPSNFRANDAWNI